MLTAVLLFAVGLVLLIKGGDWFVDSSTGIAHRFHVPELLIGATIVSIGTTLPEVMVSATSALSGHGEIAYGNAIGSVICNTALIAALSIAIHPSETDRNALKIPVLFYFIAEVIYLLVAYLTGSFSRVVGVVLLALFVVYILYTVRQIRTLPSEPAQPDAKVEPEASLLHDLIWLAAGAACIAVGAKLLVENGTIIAQHMGVPESVIALTFVALGTSLPELVTAITSLAKGHSALSLGNIIGANLFNLVLVCGTSITLSPFSLPQNAVIAGHNASLVLELPVMVFVMAFLTLPALKRGKLSRAQGIVLLCVYAAFCAIQFTL